MSDQQNTTQGGHTYPPAATAWAAVGVLVVVYIVSFVDRFILSFVVGPIKAELGLNDTEVGLLSSALTLSYAALALPVGFSLDRYSRRWVIFAGMFFWSICATLSGVAKSFTFLLLARSGVGAGEAVTTPGGYSIIGDSFPPHKLGLAMAVFTIGGSIGVGFAFLLGGPLVDLLTKMGPVTVPLLGVVQPWQQAFIVTGLPGLLLAFLIFALREPQRRKAQSVSTSTGFSEVFSFIGKYRFFYLALFFAFALAQSAMVATQVWIPAYFMRVHGWSASASGIGQGLAQMGIALVGMWWHGIAVDRLYARGKKDIHFIWGAGVSLLAIPVCLTLYGTSDAWLALGCFSLFFLLIAGMNAVGPAVLQIVTPSTLSGRMSSLYILGVLLATGLSPSIAGLLTDNVFGDPNFLGRALASYAVVALSISALLLLVARRAARNAVLDSEARMSQRS